MELKRLDDEAMWLIACEYQKDILETGEVGKLCKAVARKAEDKILRQVRTKLNEITCISDAGDRDKALTSLIYELQEMVKEGGRSAKVKD